MAVQQAPMTVRDASAPPPAKRQFVRFAFHHVLPEWRLRSPEERAADRAEVAALIAETAAADGVVLRTYSLTGTRGDADLMIWLVSENLDDLHRFAARLNATRMGAYLTTPYHYFAMTKRSTYVDKHEHEGSEGKGSRLVIVPGGRRYLFVYPFVKTRAWYRLPKEERQRQMNEHIRMGHKYPTVKINTTYSFGLDDQEFVVAFESDHVADFLDLVQEMRESEASTHTVRDTPSFTCIRCEPEDMLAALG
jgi:chlorite dismutase